VRTVREIVRDSDANTAYAMPSKAKDNQRSSIIDRFFQNYRQQLTLEMLADQLNLSTRQVNRLLKQHYNTSFKQKLLSTRIEVAKDFLRTSDLPIEHIAREIGCESPPYFYCIFQDKTGMTPSEYRTMMRSACKSVARSL
jgi:transcriptional regulator GlxA family with amidase domain